MLFRDVIQMPQPQLQLLPGVLEHPRVPQNLSGSRPGGSGWGVSMKPVLCESRSSTTRRPESTEGAEVSSAVLLQKPLFRNNTPMVEGNKEKRSFCTLSKLT